MRTAHVAYLEDFSKDLRRDVLVDIMSRPVAASDRDVLIAITDYGNNYLQRAIRDPNLANCRISFDFHFDDPVTKRSEVGLTWGYNPSHPRDEFTQEDFFYRLWSETVPPDHLIKSLDQTRDELAAYMLKGL